MTFAGCDAELAGKYQHAIEADPDASLPFLRERYREGIRWRNVLDALLPPSASPQRILDAGSGNGAVALAMTATGRYIAYGADLLLNETATRLFRGASAHAIAASGAALPFADSTFDAVLCLETIEHIPPDALHRFANELTRVLRPNGIILLTTPPRLRFLLAPDPHFGIRGLGRFFRRLTLWRMPAIWWLLLLVGIPAVFYAGLAVEGDWDECMDVVKRACEAVGRYGSRVSLVLKADIRPGYTGEISGKLARVEAGLAASEPHQDGDAGTDPPMA